MFFFGDPADIAQTYIAEALSEPGPGVQPGELEDLSVQELTHAFVYTRMAYRTAEEDEAPQAVLDAILEIYDEMFCHMVARDEQFAPTFWKGGHVILMPINTANVKKYEALVNEYTPSAN